MLFQEKLDTQPFTEKYPGPDRVRILDNVVREIQSVRMRCTTEKHDTGKHE